ncbi:MAG: hypothetical protein P8Y71_02545 [Pseudolabrys sp.]|jgi:hypothetical protein
MTLLNTGLIAVGALSVAALSAIWIRKWRNASAPDHSQSKRTSHGQVTVRLKDGKIPDDSYPMW